MLAVRLLLPCIFLWDKYEPNAPFASNYLTMSVLFYLQATGTFNIHRIKKTISSSDS